MGFVQRLMGLSQKLSFFFSGYLSDEDELPRRRGPADMSVFRDAVQDCLDYDHKSVQKTSKLKQISASNDSEIEKHSGLRIR